MKKRELEQENNEVCHCPQCGRVFWGEPWVDNCNWDETPLEPGEGAKR